MSNATGQQLSDWQKKIIGRKDRWTVVFNVVDGAMQQGGAGAIGAIRDDVPALAKEAVRNATAFQRPVQVMGKSFAPGIRINWIRRGIKWAAGGLTSAATGFGTASSFGACAAEAAAGAIGFSSLGWSGPAYPTCRWQKDKPGFALRVQAEPSAL